MGIAATLQAHEYFLPSTVRIVTSSVARIPRIFTAIAVGALMTLGALFTPSDAWACQACACGDATFAVLPADPNAHTLTAQLLATTRGERYGEGLPWEFSEWRTDLTLGWAYQRTAIALRLPWVWRSLDYEGMETNRTGGLGDIELAATYVFTRRPSVDQAVDTMASTRMSYAAVHAGLAIPTAQQLTGQDGLPIIDDVQSGTGSFTPFVGLNWSVGLNGFRLDGRHTLYIPLPGRFDFQVGPTTQQRIRLMAEPFEAFRFGVAAYGSLSAPVRHDGEIEEDTGGFVGYLDLEAEIQPHDQLVMVVGARMPVIQALRGHHRAEPGAYFGLRFQQSVKTRNSDPISRDEDLFL